MVGSSLSLSSLGGHREFHRLIHEVDETHRRFSMATYEARWLELALDIAKVALATSEGETAAAQAAAAGSQPHIVGKDLLCLDILSDVHSF